MKRFGMARLLGAATVLALGAGEAAAQRQILSAVESEVDGDGDEDIQLRTDPGALAATGFGGADTRALTDFGVNKVFARGVATHEQMASSAWLDTFTVGGAAGATVRLNFSFTVDGAVSGRDDGGAEWNYKVFALRGGGWTMNGFGGDVSYGWDKYYELGGDYDALILQQALANRVTRAEMRDFDGFYNYANAGGDPGAIQSRVVKVGEGMTAFFEVTSGAGMGGAYSVTRYYADRFERSINGGPFQSTPYTQPGVGPAMRNAYDALVANHSLLAVGGLCPHGGCSGLTGGTTVIDPYTVALSFDLAAGSTFTLASWLYADDVQDATIDFFNTAKLSGITVSDGAALTSASGALQTLPGGGFGYPAALSAVPEPATWATMIAGFAVVGGALRRRRDAVATA